MSAKQEAPRFIYNGGYRNFYLELTERMAICDSFDLSVAFIRYSGIQLLLGSFESLARRKIPGRILTSTYLNATQPKALERLLRFDNLEVRVFIPSDDRGFHSKGYIFRNYNHLSSIIGSSNITQTALKSNVEWNVFNEIENDSIFANEINREFNSQWNDEKTQILSPEFIKEYSEFLKKVNRERKFDDRFAFEAENIIPNRMQKEAIDRLEWLRRQNEKKALAIAATGTGKTYLAVLDSLRYKPKKLLFIVHREDILRKARSTFEQVIGKSNCSTGLLTGSNKDRDADYLFATIQTMQNVYREYKKDEFEYIIIDEAHHATAQSYTKVLDWFTPRFLLGLTATPERMDSGDIYSLFDNNIATEIRLRQSLEWELVCPFHYFGITEVAGVSYEGIDIDDETALAKLLMIGRRVEYIIEKILYFGHDGEKLKALGFCVNIEHAKYMASEFNQRGIRAIALTGDDSVSDRITAIRELQNDCFDLKVIFTVNIFNEGIDIPGINMILMLRPTESAIVFVQQLGRGLRKDLNKEYVTVLDFIGNHRNAFLIAIALMGGKRIEKDELKVSISTDFADIPGSTHIHMDRIAKEQILKQIENEKFMSLKYLKAEYLEFKKILNGRIPRLVDYLKVDGAVDPIRYSDYAGTWLEFICRVEKDPFPEIADSKKMVILVLSFFTSLLPCRRIYEFAIALMIIENNQIGLIDAHSSLRRYIDNPDLDTVQHSFNYLTGEYLDQAELTRYREILFNKVGDSLVASPILQNILKNRTAYSQITDLLTYGLLRYGLEFGSTEYGLPHLKLYQEYSMRNVALMNNSKKIHSSYRGQGLIVDVDSYFIFVDLHKDANIRESINYKDKFLSTSVFQWETPNSTSVGTALGKKLIGQMNLGINVHLFARKFREIEGVSQSFIYFGKVQYQDHDRELNNPMRIYYLLENEIPEDLYFELTKKV